MANVPTDEQLTKAVRAWFGDEDCPPVSADFIERMRRAFLAAAPQPPAPTCPHGYVWETCGICPQLAPNESMVEQARDILIEDLRKTKVAVDSAPGDYERFKERAEDLIADVTTALTAQAARIKELEANTKLIEIERGKVIDNLRSQLDSHMAAAKARELALEAQLAEARAKHYQECAKDCEFVACNEPTAHGDAVAQRCADAIRAKLTEGS